MLIDCYEGSMDICLTGEASCLVFTDDCCKELSLMRAMDMSCSLKRWRRGLKPG
jgi:hypothetical protein